MKFISFDKLLYEDFNVMNMIAINKRVKSGQTFHVFDETRTTSVFVYLKDCNISYKISKKEIYAKKGSIVYIPHTVKYDVTYISESNNDALAQLLAFEMYDISGNNLIACNNIEVVCDSTDNIYKDKFEKAISLSNMASFEPTVFKSVFYSLIADISKSFIARQNANNKYIIMPSVKFMENNDIINITVSDLAKMSHISDSCLRKHFKMLYGKTPHEMIKERKIEASKNLLRDSNYTINEISEMLGFNDVTYFSKVFKKTVGVSPVKYRCRFII